MDSSEMKPIEQIKNCIKDQHNFVLQGGAGSGKTETLKECLEFISKFYPQKKVACITHTNLAANEILSRVDVDYKISTIHSFLNELIKDYSKNIHQVIFDIFKLNVVERLPLSDFSDEKEHKKAEHENYKNLHSKLSKKLFLLNKNSLDKVTGKREYDKNPDQFNELLNSQINTINLEIKSIIESRDRKKSFYNESSFDSFKDLTYGHDGLIEVAYLIFSRYPMMSRILQDKFDVIFIDEFQDTNPKIIDIFLNKLTANDRTIIGLFGDSMQGIYEDGIGDVNHYIENKQLFRIPKLDNYRCSEQVIKFLNHNRLKFDGLEQKVALKIINGQLESMGDRQGFIKIYYSIYPNNRPTLYSKHYEKDDYSKALMHLMDHVESENKNFKKLMLTNKAISQKLDFSNLFNVFSDRYSEVSGEIENFLESLQLLELVDLCVSYSSKKYNYVINMLKKNGFKINSVEDKNSIKNTFDSLIDGTLSAFGAIQFAIKNNVIAPSDSYRWRIKNRNDFLNESNSNDELNLFKKAYYNDGHTFIKFDSQNPDFFDNDGYTGREERYDSLVRLLERQRFYEDFFSDKVPFKEIVNYFHYLNENTDYITMHKTKGSGIDNVLVVLDDFYWSKYKFKALFEPNSDSDSMKERMQKLFYVACSRSKKNLICVRIITAEEEADFIGAFPAGSVFSKFEVKDQNPF